MCFSLPRKRDEPASILPEPKGPSSGSSPVGPRRIVAIYPDDINNDASSFRRRTYARPRHIQKAIEQQDRRYQLAQGQKESLFKWRKTGTYRTSGRRLEATGGYYYDGGGGGGFFSSDGGGGGGDGGGGGGGGDGGGC